MFFFSLRRTTVEAPSSLSAAGPSSASVDLDTVESDSELFFDAFDYLPSTDTSLSLTDSSMSSCLVSTSDISAESASDNSIDLSEKNTSKSLSKSRYWSTAFYGLYVCLCVMRVDCV